MGKGETMTDDARKCFNCGRYRSISERGVENDCIFGCWNKSVFTGHNPQTPGCERHIPQTPEILEKIRDYIDDPAYKWQQFAISLDEIQVLLMEVWSKFGKLKMKVVPDLTEEQNNDAS